MFFGQPKNPTKFKKAVYLASATSLGILLSFIAHALIEINYLSLAARQGITVTFYGGCALWPPLQIGLWVLGIGGGFWLGQIWWKKVYVDRVWAKK